MTKSFFVSGLLFVSSSCAWGFEMPLQGLTGPSSPKTVVNYGGIFMDDGSVQHQKGSISVPVWRSKESSISLGAKSDHFALGRDLVLPNSSVIVPKSLKDTEFSLGYSTKLSEAESAGGRISMGSASDRPFTGSRVSSLAGSVFWSFPAEKNPKAKWILSLNYSNNNSVTSLPIPGVAYLFVEPQMIGLFGLPFAYMRWVPSEGSPWAFSGFWLLTFLKAEAAYGPPFMNAFLRFETGQETWLRADREIAEDRLTYDEKSFTLGGRMPLSKWLFVEARTGYAFDRKFFEGESFLKKRTGDAKLDDGLFYAIDLRSTF